MTVHNYVAMAVLSAAAAGSAARALRAGGPGPRPAEHPGPAGHAPGQAELAGQRDGGEHPTPDAPRQGAVEPHREHHDLSHRAEVTSRSTTRPPVG